MFMVTVAETNICSPLCVESYRTLWDLVDVFLYSDVGDEQCRSYVFCVTCGMTVKLAR